MQFRTTIEIKPFDRRIDHSQTILSLGSCFASNVAERLSRAKFCVTSSPTGILFNPESIAATLDRFDAVARGDNGALPAAEDLAYGNERWFSYDFHSDFSATDATDALAAMQEAVRHGAQALKDAQVVIITFGTAFVFRNKQSGDVVTNCHKQPQALFQREMMSAEQIATRYISLMQGPLAGKQVIFTVSPVRHLADGLEHNSLSKATLRVAVDLIQKACPNAYYFPSYEIVMDELRDYRFYADDMTHPSRMAIDYIWERFGEVAFSDKTKALNERIERIVKASEHRPFNRNGQEYKAFCRTQREKISQLESEHPSVCMAKEKEFFDTYL
ncbi:MAG: GSCFA domain-containing protein [Alistipes sp.]|nr:GSCFA domain-containing protein [Alistipes sp.]